MTISGLTSTLTMSSRSVATLPSRHQRRRQRLAVDGALAAELAEKALRRELVDHLVGGHPIDRRRAEGDVGDGLGEDAPDAEHDGGAELLVAQHAGDQLAVAADHRRHEHVDVAVLGACRGEQFAGGAAHGVGITEAEADEAALGLVGDGVTVELGDDRVPEGVGGGHGIVHAARQALRRDRHPVAGEQLLGFGLGQGAARHRPRGY